MINLHQHVKSEKTTGAFHRRSKVIDNLKLWLAYNITDDIQWDVIMKMCNDYYKDFK